ncbi:MAG TPA: cupin domain-containing protein [Bacteroidia bacterium]|nr:cupin domain-containing protein [Bacteroidia bacterium]
MKLISALFLLCFPFLLIAQNHQSVDTIAVPANTENIFSRPLYGDSLTSSFLIVVKKEVKPHLHLFHSEQVYVLSGEAEMTLGDQKFMIKAGDLIFIPKNTPHAATVTSAVPLKIISIQSPYFDGTDRVPVGK